MWSNPGFWIVCSALLSAGAAITAAVAGYKTLKEQDRQIATLQAWLTGGNSYVYYVPLREPGRLAYFIRHGGDYPAFDVYLRVQDANGRLIYGPEKVADMLRAGAGVEWLTRPPLIFPDPPKPDTPPFTIRLEIATRNGIYVQRLHLKVINGHWNTDSRDFGGVPLPPFPEAQDQP